MVDAWQSYSRTELTAFRGRINQQPPLAAIVHYLREPCYFIVFVLFFASSCNVFCETYLLILCYYCAHWCFIISIQWHKWYILREP